MYFITGFLGKKEKMYVSLFFVVRSFIQSFTKSLIGFFVPHPFIHSLIICSLCNLIKLQLGNMLSFNV